MDEFNKLRDEGQRGTKNGRRDGGDPGKAF